MNTVSPYTGITFNERHEPISAIDSQPIWMSPPKEGDPVDYSMQDGAPLAHATTY